MCAAAPIREELANGSKHIGVRVVSEAEAEAPARSSGADRHPVARVWVRTTPWYHPLLRLLLTRPGDAALLGRARCGPSDIKPNSSRGSIRGSPP